MVEIPPRLGRNPARTWFVYCQDPVVHYHNLRFNNLSIYIICDFSYAKKYFLSKSFNNEENITNKAFVCNIITRHGLNFIKLVKKIELVKYPDEVSNWRE